MLRISGWRSLCWGKLLKVANIGAHLESLVTNCYGLFSTAILNGGTIGAIKASRACMTWEKKTGWRIPWGR